jgi:hypothetical protein
VIVVVLAVTAGASLLMPANRGSAAPTALPARLAHGLDETIAAQQSRSAES